MPNTRPPVLATRPVLRPGQAPVPRGDARLHLGGDLVASVLLPDDADVRRLLDDLADPARPWRMPTAPSAVRALTELLEAGLVVAAPQQDLERRLAGQHGPSWPARTAARTDAVVHLAGATPMIGPLRSLLTEEGVRADVVELEHLTSLPPESLLVAVTEGPIRRDLLDAVVAPQLLVSAAPPGWQVGPFIVPGRTACLRCVDAARSVGDPRLPRVVDQWARRTRTTTAPLSGATQQLALALATREVLAWVDGETPTTWSATLTVTGTGLPTRTTWLRHPDCSCVWDLVLAEDLEDLEAG